MKPVSEEYKKSMASPLRNPSHLRIRFGNINTEAALDGEWESNGQMPYSRLDTLDFPHQYGETYNTLELNRWVLNGKGITIPDDTNYDDGFISDRYSDNSGKYTNRPVLTRRFSKLISVPGITFTFDSRLGEFPRTLYVRFLNNDSLVKQLTVHPTDTLTKVEGEVKNFNKIQIEAVESLPSRRFRLESVEFGIGELFTDDIIISTKQNHDVDPICRRLPKETCEFTIMDLSGKYDPENPNSGYKYIGGKSPVAFEFGYDLPDGKTEWLRPDRYIMTSKPVSKKNVVTFKANSLLSSLTDIYRKGIVARRTFYDLAVDVLQDAKLTPSVLGGNPWVISDFLKQWYTEAPLPMKTHAECLQLIAHACCCVLYTDDNNIIHIEPFSTTKPQSDFNLDYNSIEDYGQTFTMSPPLREIQVLQYTYNYSNQDEVAYEGITDDTKVQVEYDRIVKAPKLTVVGGTVISSKLYAKYAELELSPGTKTIRILGKRQSVRTFVRNTSTGNAGEVDVVKNPMLTETNVSFNLLNHLYKYLKLQNNYDIIYRGNPELETGDVISFETRYDKGIPGIVLTDEITYNGSLKGRLKVKRR